MLKASLIKLLLAYTTLALALFMDGGSYSPFALGTVLISFSFLLWAAWAFVPLDHSRDLERCLVLSLFVFTLVAPLQSPILELKHTSYRYLHAAINESLALGCLFFLWGGEKKKLGPYLKFFRGYILFAWILRALIPWASPAPSIDVFAMFQESAAHLLQGLNPYTTPVTDVYGGQGLKKFGYEILGYAYPPSNLYLQTLFYSLFRDIRWGYFFSEIVYVGALFKLTPRARIPLLPELVCLLFLFQPCGLFALEQAWNEPFLLASFALFVYGWIQKPHRVGSALAYGFFLSLKQYLIFFAFHGLMLEKKIKNILLALLVLVLTVIPFLIWDAPELWKYGFLFQLKTPFRPSGLTVFSGLYPLLGLTVDKTVTALLGALCCAWTFYRFKNQGLVGYLWASSLTTFVIFLFGSQAFCNYYYFLGGILLFLFVCLLREGEKR